MAKAASPKRPSGHDMPGGILPAQAIRRLIAAGQILCAAPPAEGQIQPASLDLRLGAIAYRVRASFLPGPSATVQEKLDDLALHVIDLTRGAVLETGCVYVVPLLESLALPADIAAAANPKSSTGRLDVFTRVIADGVASFDQIPAGYAGGLYAEICPQTFPVVVRQGSTLTQLRLRRGDPRESDAQLAALHAREPLVTGGLAKGGMADIDHGVALSVIGAPLGVPYNHIAATDIEQHRRGDLAGISPRRLSLGAQILRPQGDPAARQQRRRLGQIQDRRTHHHLSRFDLAHALQYTPDPRPGSGLGTVHLPVPGHQLLATHATLLKAAQLTELP